MKVSISLTDDDLAYLDAETAAGAFPSRSAVIAAAIRTFRNRDLVAAYSEAFVEWSGSDDEADWDATVVDGVA